MRSTSASTSTGASAEARRGRPPRPAGSRLRAAGLAAVLTAGVLPPGAPAQGRSPDVHYGIEVELVNVFATVWDRAGRLVTGLGSGDFVVYDDGIPQPISQFSREYAPLSVIIVLDCSSSMRGTKLANARRALDQFLERLRPGDEAMLITFQTRPRVVQEFTGDFGRVRKGLKHLEGNGSTALYDAILAALDQGAAARRRRRTLLLVSDGINNYGRARQRETIERLRVSGFELFAIGLESNLPEDLQERSVTRRVLDELTRAAGGEAFVTAEAASLARICAAISDRMHNQYTFGYYPPRGADGEWRSVRVQTRMPGLRVVASKSGYYPVRPAAPRSN